jgi:hypothetical protein
MAWYGLLVLYRSTTMQNFGLLARKWLSYGYVKYLVFGMIWYFMVWYGMAWYGLLVLYRSTTMQNFGLLT